MSSVLHEVRVRAQRVLKHADVHVGRYHKSHEARRLELIERAGVAAVLDVGANRGQYACRLREDGYRGRIVSLEPLAEPFAALAVRAEGDPAWECRRLAVAETAGQREMHTAGNVVSSSLLPMQRRHLEAAPESSYVGSEQITAVTLDDLVADVLGAEDPFFLKLDVQGYEGRILQAAPSVLDRVAVLEIELSTVPLYEGSMLLPEVVAFLAEAGLLLDTAWPNFVDPRSGVALQLDALFARASGPSA